MQSSSGFKAENLSGRKALSVKTILPSSLFITIIIKWDFLFRLCVNP